MPNMINGMTPITYSPASMDNFILNPYAYGSSYIPSDYGMIANKGGNNFMETMSLINEGLGTALGGPVGTLIGAGLNFVGGQLNADLQQKRQKELYEKFMSPQARMRDMVAAGINPAAAAQGISGAGNASMPSAPAATPSSPSLADTLGQSNNTYLSADMVKAQADLFRFSSELSKSQNTEQVIKNQFIERRQLQELHSLTIHNIIDDNVASMIAVDEFYKGAEAQAHWQQTCMALQETSQRINNLTQEYFNMLAQEVLIYEQAGFTRNQSEHELIKMGLTKAQISEVYHKIDNIDANTMLTMQNISESQSRERMNKAQAWYQEEVNAVWKNSGYNMNSDFNGNFYGNVMRGDIKAAERMLSGMTAYIYGVGDARFHSKDYMMDGALQILGTASRLAGSVYVGSSVPKRVYQPVGRSVPGAKIK